MTRVWSAVAGMVLLAGIGLRVEAQHAGAFRGSIDDPAIAYSTGPLNNVVLDVNRGLQDGSVRFTFDERSGFLQSTLDALRLAADSQLLVFSRGSLQGKRIGEQNPRAIFFNDRVALGWVRGGDVIEVAAHDATQGIVFYALEQRADAAPSFKRRFECLGCHVTGDTLGVPGLLMFSTSRREEGQFDGVPRHVDQSDPLEKRFGGWFVTGSRGAPRSSVEGLFDPGGYRALTSDIVAHLVLTHQAGMTNLLTRAAFEARAASGQADAVAAVLNGIAREVVDHLLFVDEAKLPGPIAGNSGFAERFSASGPRDSKGRSLYELDLRQRIMKYPCSYMIYSPAFDALPAMMKAAIYRRMWDVLSAWPRGARQPIVEILLDTKKDLPSYFVSASAVSPRAALPRAPSPGGRASRVQAPPAAADLTARSSRSARFHTES